jgi:hypothetical protein
METFFVIKNRLQAGNLGYTIYPNGSQFYKKIEKYEVLITDLSMRPALDIFTRKLIMLWIKDSSNDVILFEKIYKPMFKYPSLDKINKDALYQITVLRSS